jgi:hypothetical protein
VRICNLPEPVIPEADFPTGAADLSESDFSRFNLSDFQCTRSDFMGPCFHPDGDSGSM